MNSKGSNPIQNNTDLHSPERLFPERIDACELTLSCAPEQFSASRIAHAVEDADAHLLNLNVTSILTDHGHPIIDIRVSHRNGGSVASSLDRYGFTVLSMHNALDAHAMLATERLGNLISQLKV